MRANRSSHVEGELERGEISWAAVAMGHGKGPMWGALQMGRKDLGGHRVRHRLKEALIAILCKCHAGHWPFLTSAADGGASPENTQPHSFT